MAGLFGGSALTQARRALLSWLPFVAATPLLWLVQHFWAEQRDWEYVFQNINHIGIAIILAVSLNLVNGLTGQFSIGHAGFMAVGGYVSAVLLLRGPAQDPYRLFFIASIAAGAGAAALAGWLVGKPSLRLRGDYLAIVTLGFGEIIRVIIENTPLFGRAIGLSPIPRYADFTWIWTAAIATILITKRLRDSTHGRAFLSVREDEVAAEAMGVDTTGYKVRAFVISAGIAGVAGALSGSFEGNLSPQSFTFVRSFRSGGDGRRHHRLQGARVRDQRGHRGGRRRALRLLRRKPLAAELHLRPLVRGRRHGGAGRDGIHHRIDHRRRGADAPPRVPARPREPAHGHLLDRAGGPDAGASARPAGDPRDLGPLALAPRQGRAAAGQGAGALRSADRRAPRDHPLRRTHRRLRLLADGKAPRAGRADRPQWRGQDHRVQPAHRRLPAHRGQHPGARPGHARAGAARHRAPRAGAHFPEQPPLPRADRVRQRAPRLPPPDPRVDGRLGAQGRAGGGRGEVDHPALRGAAGGDGPAPPAG